MNAIGPWIAPVVLFSIVLVITAILRVRDGRKPLEKRIVEQAAKQAVLEAQPSGPSGRIGSYRDFMEDQQSQGRRALLN